MNYDVYEQEQADRDYEIYRKISSAPNVGDILLMIGLVVYIMRWLND